MALIPCPECGAQVSDRAPACPHCGVPIAGNLAAAAAPAPVETAAILGDAPASPEPEGATPARIEPFQIRLAGRRIPIALILFWGGMVVGVVMHYAFPLAEGAEPEQWRSVPMYMVWTGVLWFAVTEFYALMRNRLLRRR